MCFATTLIERGTSENGVPESFHPAARREKTYATSGIFQVVHFQSIFWGEMKVSDLHNSFKSFIVQSSHSPHTVLTLACSAGVFFERAICSRKRHVETSRREEEMGRVKGSGEGARREKRKRLHYFYSPQSSTVIKSQMAATTILCTRTRFRPPKIRLHCRLSSHSPHVETGIKREIPR